MTQKTHYAQKAAKKFLRNTPYSTVDEAIKAGARSNAQFEAFMLREAQAFWSANGRKARKYVKRRHPVRRKTRVKKGVNGQILDKSCPIRTNNQKKEVLALENHAKEWAKIQGFDADGRYSQRLCLDMQAKAAYDLFLDFVRLGVAGDFKRWLAKHSGFTETTCHNRLRAGVALAAGKELRFDKSGKPVLRPATTQMEAK